MQLVHPARPGGGEGQDEVQLAKLHSALDEIEITAGPVYSYEIEDLYQAAFNGFGRCLCGDGIVDPDEVCDDGNTNENDGCTSACTVGTACGDGIVQVGEACDDGAAQQQCR